MERKCRTEGGALKTKIVCTLGPSSLDGRTLAALVRAGMDVARINSGHCEPSDVPAYAAAAREAGEAVGRRVGVILDLQGPRLRVGDIEGEGALLVPGQEFTITTRDETGDSSRASTSYGDLPGDLRPGDEVLIDDGRIRLRVLRISGDEISCEVIEGGTLRSGKGMNLPGADISLAAFTGEDRRYLEAGLGAGVDWIAQSFVRTADDVRDLKAAIGELGSACPVMAKIEKPEALSNIDRLLAEADGIMVARGDLGVEMNVEDVPLVQKDLISRAPRFARPVVTATQMLESMVHNPRPTRAEASDVANAILDGTDAVMLSAETAVGAYPVQAVEMMASIAERTEPAIDYREILEARGRWAEESPAAAIGYAACKVAEDMRAKAIIAMTRSGYSARMIARYRPRGPLVAVSPSETVLRELSVVWGVKGLRLPEYEGLVESIATASDAAEAEGIVEKGDLVVIVGGLLDERSGKTNVVHLHTVR